MPLSFPLKIYLPKEVLVAIGLHKGECNTSLLDIESGMVLIQEELFYKFKNLFNIESQNSCFVAFYAATPFPIMNENGPELLSLNSIIDNSKSEYFVDFFSDPLAVKDLLGVRFFVLTSGEGGSFFIYDSKSDGVYDSYDIRGIGTGEPLPAPKWITYCDFIACYYQNGSCL